MNWPNNSQDFRVGERLQGIDALGIFRAGTYSGVVSTKKDFPSFTICKLFCARIALLAGISRPHAERFNHNHLGEHMTRKKESEIETTPAKAGATTIADPESKGTAGENPDGSANREWGNPYKAIFVSKAKGFEMGENRRFKQRAFIFAEKPDQGIIDTLKEHGFQWRMGDKAWTIEATPANRVLSDQLAREFAGQAQDQGMSR
jgi:hypothetical protein